MADWRGRGQGRTGNNNGSLSLKGGAGLGGGRGSAPNPTPSITGGGGKGGGRGSQPNPNLTINGGGGKGGGRGDQPNYNPTITGGGGKGGGRGDQPNVSPTITGGKGKGQGRDGSQPTLSAAVEYGGTSLDFKMKGSMKSSTSSRAETSIGPATGPETSPRVADPEGSFIFALELQDSSGKNAEVAQFREVSGLKSTTAVFELEEGGQNHRVHKLPGQSRWDNITLRYAVCADVALLTWRNEILADEFGKRRNGSIVMKTLHGEEVRRYNFFAGWPVSWEGPSFNAESAELAVETLEIAHGGIQIT